MSCRPEYAGRPAELSQAAIEQQQMVLNPLDRHVEALIEVVNVSKTLIAGGEKLLPGEPVLQEYKANSQLCERYLNEVIVAIGENAPGQVDCDSALKQLRAKIEETNSVLMQVMVGEEIGANSSKYNSRKIGKFGHKTTKIHNDVARSHVKTQNLNVGSVFA